MSGIIQDLTPLRSRAVDDAGVPLTAVEPDGAPRGGIIVLHESRAFPDSLLELMKAFAADGWIAVAPHLFHRDANSTDEVFGDDLFDDFDATFDWLVGRGVFPDCVGVLGFDDAGTAALIVATSRPIGAAVSVAAGGITEPIAPGAIALVDAAPALQVPWLGLFGEDDEHTPHEHIELLRDAATHAPVATNLVSYAGLDHRADVNALDDAQRRIFDWFDSFLR